MKQLIETDFIIIKKYSKPVRWTNSTEIIIYGDEKEAEEDAQAVGGVVVSCGVINTNPLYTKIKEQLLTQINNN